MLALTGGAAGPWLMGRIVDATGAYAQAWSVAAAVAFMGVPLFLLAAPPNSLQREYGGVTSKP